MTALAVIAALLSSMAPSEVVARVDRTHITAAALARRLESAVPGTRPEQTLQTMIDEALLSAEGRRLKLEASPAAKARFETLQRMAAGALLLEKEIAGRAAPDDAMLRRLFHSTSDFAAFDVLTFETAERAAAALEQVRKGAAFGADLSGVVTSRVQADASGAPLAMRGQLPSTLADALFAAEPRAIVGPVQLAEGVALARLLRKVVGTEAEFGTKRPALLAHAKKQLTEQMKGHAVAQLRERAHVTLDEAFLRSVDELEPTPQQLDHVLATVGGTTLRYRDIFDAVRAIRATGGHMGPAIRVSVAWREIDARLLQNVAVERGFLNAPEVVALRTEHQDAAVGYAAMTHVMNAARPPTEDEIVRFYERHSATFGRPFAEVLPAATAGAAREKREAAYVEAVTSLRENATISVDREVLARTTRPGA